MYDKDTGIYPSGHYIVGEDIPLGGYYFTAKQDKTGSLELFSNYSDYKELENSIIYENFEEDFFLTLTEEGEYLIVDRADMKNV